MNNRLDSARIFSRARSAIAAVSIALLATACGGGDSGGSSRSDVAILAVLAGNMGGPGSIDGTGAAARFFTPQAVASDKAGNLYVADESNCTIRKITSAAVVTTLAGKAGDCRSEDGTGASARFGAFFPSSFPGLITGSTVGPSGIATDSQGNVYVADTGNNTIRKITPLGVVTTLAGTSGTPRTPSSSDGIGAAASFASPHGLATDNADNVYVADTGNQIIRKISPAGLVTTLAGTAGKGGVADGTGASARFWRPISVATDNAGNIYVADGGAIRKISPAGMVTTLAGMASDIGSADGLGEAARFYNPQGVTVDGAGNVYVADTNNNTVRKIAPAGVVTTLAGTANARGIGGSDDGTGAAATFHGPSGITADSAGNLYVADRYNNTIRRVTPAGVVTTLAGTSPATGNADGIGVAATFGPIYADTGAIATDSAGNVYVADSDNSIIRKITAAGVVTTLAGMAGEYGSVDGTGAAARFTRPTGVAVDSAGNVYVADSGNRTVRKITPAGVVTTLAGMANSDSYGPGSDGTGVAARFIDPRVVAVDSAGNVYVADSGIYGTTATVRKITPAGVVTTLAGTFDFLRPIGVDGPGAMATFSDIEGIATDSAGNIYVTDSRNSTIRKITPAGTVTTLAGTAGVRAYADGSGAAARFAFPMGITIDSTGNIYVADTGNQTIRKITPTGVVTTIAGIAGQYGFIAGPLPGGLSNPSGIAISGSTLYIRMLQGVAVVTNLP